MAGRIIRHTNWLSEAYPPFSAPLDCDTLKDIKRLLKDQRKARRKEN